MKVAIQGIRGSYHHQVATQLYQNLELLECSSFDQLALAVSNHEVKTGIMAIGNSIAGSILPNYSLIKDYDLKIIGEYYLNIQHQLMALHGQEIKDIIEVQSHPMALLQCKPFFSKHPNIKLVETDDTAAAALRISEGNKRGVAAIASKNAAQLYDLKIINGDIQEVKNNATRFIILEAKERINNQANKATISFTASHEPGSLAKILTKLGELHINVSKIQSVPIIEKPFLFSFVADLEFDNVQQFEQARLEIGILVESMKILGIYKSHEL
ncbi:prephenate dehydratase [Nonlabens dokdonensis]|uniref:prephenate dehydratase n=1 Tax=Nonlabens dokdonensis TaxID=328515 RepID=A0A1Z8AN66_9FLAO|nr:prephenate dehydratase domain-containing protein [Nonlabens dokdonensis]OUS11761.1 prephenate dehydratase [Nonlabens dokdonensis]